MKKKEKRKFSKPIIKEVILNTVATAGMISVALLAPNAVQSLSLFGNFRRKYYPSYIRQKITILHKQGLIKFKRNKKQIIVCLTPKGEKTLEQCRLMQEQDKQREQKWDGKWRLVIFDIKEYRKNVRNRLRYELVNFGFYRLQNSVWIYPYSCEDLLILLKADLKIGKDVLCMLVEKIEG